MIFLALVILHCKPDLHIKSVFLKTESTGPEKHKSAMCTTNYFGLESVRFCANVICNPVICS